MFEYSPLLNVNQDTLFIGSTNTVPFIFSPSLTDQDLKTKARTLTRQPHPDRKLFHKLFNKKEMPTLKLARNVETTEVSTKVSEFENMKTLMNNLRQILGHTQPSISISLLPSRHGPYCKDITITGSAHTIMQQMLTQASNAALQLEVCTYSSFINVVILYLPFVK